VIVEWFLGVLADLFHAMMGAIPPFTPPEWLSSIGGAAGTLFSYASSMGAWYPAGLTLTVVLAVLTVWGVGFAIKIARMILSLFTAGGGSAA
jgi:hypothetical protein